MTEVLAFAQGLSGVGFGTLLVLILYGSFKEYWVWGRQLTELRADYERRLVKESDDKKEWRSIALSATGLAEHGVVLAKQRVDGMSS